MLHMFGHGRQKENIILVPYVHSFFVCAFIHVLHGRLYYVSILLLLLLLYYYYYYYYHLLYYYYHLLLLLLLLPTTTTSECVRE